jgi:adenylate cyclase
MKFFRIRHDASIPSALLISAVVFFVIVGFRSIGSLEFLGLTSYDWFIRLLPGSDVPAPVTVIGISEEDIHRQGRWPITDATLAKALKNILQHKPRAIGLDIYRDIPVPPGSEELNSILEKHSNIIAATTFGQGGVPPPAVINDTEQIGFNDILVDPGGIVRRALIFQDDGYRVFYSFALRLALIYLKEKGIVPVPDPLNTDHIRLGNTTIPPFEPNDGAYVEADARGYQFLLDFREIHTQFPSYSLSSLLSGEVDPGTINDRIVLIGVDAQSVKDTFYTPHSRGLQDQGQVSGINLHAYIISQLLRFAAGRTSPMDVLTQNQEVLWIFFWSMVGGAVGLCIRSSWRFAAIITGGILILFMAAYVAFVYHWWIPPVPSAISWLISASLVTAYMSNYEKRQRTVLMRLFSKHVSEEIVETIWEQREQFLDGGRPRAQKMDVSVFFSDLRGFTGVSEKMDPKDLIDWLNTYMESMAQLVMRYSGVIDDYAGDGIKANFGVPIPRVSEAEIRNDAINAVECALAMEKEIYRLNTYWRERNLPAVGMRIGIFTGPVVAGLLGSSQRMKYTTVGDTVNIAARLENYDRDLAKETLCRILIGELTLDCLDGRFETQRIGETILKGKTKTVPIYRVIGKLGESSKHR